MVGPTFCSIAYLLSFPQYAEFNDKINQRGTDIHKFDEAFALTMINYLLLNSALVFVRAQKYFALCSI